MIMQFLGLYWKHMAVVAAFAALIGGFFWWKDSIEDAAYDRGFGVAEEQFTAAVNEANAREMETQGRLNQMTVAFNGLAQQREQGVNLTVRPIIQRIENEIAQDPRYSECVVSSGVLDSINAGRSSVDQSIAASNPDSD